MKEKLIWNRQQKALFERRYNNKEKEFNKLVKDGEHERQILNEIRNSKLIFLSFVQQSMFLFHQFELL